MIRPTFFGIEIGKTGLTMSQLGLDVTGHNIANADTKGYTRQRLITTAYDPYSTIGRLLPVDDAKVGGGVKVKILDQIRDAYLDRRYRTENNVNAYWTKRTQGLTYVEAYFDNIREETSISTSVDALFRAMKVLAEDAVEGAPRTLLREAGKDLADHLNSVYASLVELQGLQNVAVKTTVGEINRIAREITDLNKSVYAYEVTGHLANDLKDKRNLLLDELSSLVAIEYREEPDGTGMTTLSVWIGTEKNAGPDAIKLVDHEKYRELGVREVNNVIEGEPSVWETYWLNKPDTGPWDVYFTVGNKKIGIDLIDPGINADHANATARLNAIVPDINSIAVNISNERITPGSTGQTAKYWIDELSKLVRGVEVDSAGAVRINGEVFVSAAGVLPVPWTNVCTIGGNIPKTFTTNNGELRAYIELRDSMDVNTQGIPYYIEMLNNLARALVQEINMVHGTGWSDGTAGSETGIDFFGAKDASGSYIPLAGQWQNSAGTVILSLDPANGYYDSSSGPPYTYINPAKEVDAAGKPVYTYTVTNINDVTAKNLCMSAAVLASEFNIACSDVRIVKHGLPDELQRGNNKNMNELYKLFNKKDITINGSGVDIGSFDGYVTKIRFDVASTLSYAKKTFDSSTILTISVENQKKAVSDVSLDEEMTNMIKYQHAYSGASRVITAMDEALDVLINRTGRVGL